MSIPIPTVKFWFLILSCDSWILVLCIKNDFFGLVFCVFPRVAMWNLILVLIISLPISTVDSSPLQIVVSWNGVDDDFSLFDTPPSSLIDSTMSPR